MAGHGLVALATSLLLSMVSCALGSKMCAEYSTSTCLFGNEVRDAVKNARCSPSTCNFDIQNVSIVSKQNSLSILAGFVCFSPRWSDLFKFPLLQPILLRHCLQEFECAFPETGTYTYANEPPTGCEDPFMSTHRAPPSTDCGDRCCTSVSQGKYEIRGKVPNTNAPKYAFQPQEESCRYDEISRGQLMHYLNAASGPIAVIGDSIMRQFFLRLVMMIRGQRRLLDYHIHTHARFSVCHEADAFRLASPSENGDLRNSSHERLQTIIPGFFTRNEGPGRAAAQKSLSSCSKAVHEVHYLFAPRWYAQNSFLPIYLDSQPALTKPVVVTSVGYWEKSLTVPQNYLDMLVTSADKATKVIIVSAPTVKVPTVPKVAGEASQYEIIKTRNEFMKKWVEQQDGDKFLYLDFDALSVAKNKPPLPGGTDK